jgi:DNA polymerase III delta prime subunit
LDFLKARLDRQGGLDSHRLACQVVDLALKLSPGRKPVDDVSAAVVHFRVPRRCVLFTGPPFEKRRDSYYASSFAGFKGRKAVCGGTTAQLLARELGRSLRVGHESRGGLPPMSIMEGVDLVTEWLVTMTRAIVYLEANDTTQADAAGALTRFLLSHDMIHIMEGTGINVANFDPSSSFDHDVRRNVVKRLAETLRTKHLKSVKIQRV